MKVSHIKAGNRITRRRHPVLEDPTKQISETENIYRDQIPASKRGGGCVRGVCVTDRLSAPL